MCRKEDFWLDTEEKFSNHRNLEKYCIFTINNRLDGHFSAIKYIYNLSLFGFFQPNFHTDVSWTGNIENDKKPVISTE